MKSFRWLRYALVTALVLAVPVVYADAPAGRYTVGSGTVTDTKTGLVWQEPDDGLAYTFGNAAAHCASLTLAGQSDWRLPTIKELQTLVDYTKSTGPLIDSHFTVTGNSYGSASYPPNLYYALWRVNFNEGGASYPYSSMNLPPFQVRCVR